MPPSACIPTVLILFLLSTAASTHHHRHLLHQPFFPVTITAVPPAQSPAISPQPQPRSPTHQPKFPFSSATPNTPQKPFFPTFPSPPPPPPHSLATFPANISSLFPKPPSSSSSPFTGRHLIISLVITLSLLLAAILAFLSAFLIHSRRHHYKPSTAAEGTSRKTENSRLFPPNKVPSDSPPPPPRIPNRPGVPSTNSSEFLYLGTLANPHTPDYQQRLSVLAHHVGVKAGVSSSTSATTASPYQKLGSPELRPLPPLPKYIYNPTYRSGDVLLGPNAKRHDSEVEDDEEEDGEEFNTPKGSPGRTKPLGFPSPVQVVGRSGSSSGSDIRVQGGSLYGSNRSFNSKMASYELSNAGYTPTNHMYVDTIPSHTSKSSHRGGEFEDHSPETIISFSVPVKRSSPPSVSCSSSLLSSPASSLSSPRDRGTGTSWNMENSPPVKVLGFQRRDETFRVNQTIPSARLPHRPPPPPPPSFWELPIGPIGLPSSERPHVLVVPPGRGTFQSEVSVSDREHVQGNLGCDMNVETPEPKLKSLH